MIFILTRPNLTNDTKIKDAHLKCKQGIFEKKTITFLNPLKSELGNSSSSFRNVIFSFKNRIEFISMPNSYLMTLLKYHVTRSSIELMH